MQIRGYSSSESSQERDAQARGAEPETTEVARADSGMMGLLMGLQHSVGNQAVNRVLRHYAARRQPVPEHEEDQQAGGEAVIGLKGGPLSPEIAGGHLLAHELTHVARQQTLHSPGGSMVAGPADASSERDADAVAAAVTQARGVPMPARRARQESFRRSTTGGTTPKAALWLAASGYSASLSTCRCGGETFP